MLERVPELLADLDRHVPPDAPPLTRHERLATVGGAAGPHALVLRAHVDRAGRRHEHLLLDGVRVQRTQLLTLTCPETACGQVRELVQRWHDFRRRSGRPAVPPLRRDPAPPPPPPQTALVQGPVRCDARSTVFSFRVTCPHRVHGPREVLQRGLDLFEDGVFVGGSWVVVDGRPRPRLHHIEQAQAWMLARQLEAMVALSAAREPGPPVP